MTAHLPRSRSSTQKSIPERRWPWPSFGHRSWKDCAISEAGTFWRTGSEARWRGLTTLCNGGSRPSSPPSSWPLARSTSPWPIRLSIRHALESHQPNRL